MPTPSSEIISKIVSQLGNQKYIKPITQREQVLIELAVGMALGWPDVTDKKLDKVFDEQTCRRVWNSSPAAVKRK